MPKFSDERVRAMVRGSRQLAVYPYPGEGDLEIAVRVLTDGEMDACRVAAQVDLRKLAKKRGWSPESAVTVDPEMLDRAMERQLIFRAFYDAETIDQERPDAFFAEPGEVAQLGAVTVAALTSIYLEHQTWVCPLIQASDEDVDALIEALGKAPRPGVLLGRYERATLQRLLTSMASRLRTST